MPGSCFLLLLSSPRASRRLRVGFSSPRVTGVSWLRRGRCNSPRRDPRQPDQTSTRRDRENVTRNLCPTRFPCDPGRGAKVQRPTSSRDKVKRPIQVDSASHPSTQAERRRSSCQGSRAPIGLGPRPSLSPSLHLSGLLSFFSRSSAPCDRLALQALLACFPTSS